MSEAVTTMHRLQAVQDASAEFLLRWVAETMMDETLCSDKLWGDLCPGSSDADHGNAAFSKYRGRLDD